MTMVASRVSDIVGHIDDLVLIDDVRIERNAERSRDEERTEDCGGTHVGVEAVEWSCFWILVFGVSWKGKRDIKS